MPCDTYIPVNMTPPQRRKQIDEADKRCTWGKDHGHPGHSYNATHVASERTPDGRRRPL